jgi:N-acetylneuraminate synthase
MDEAALRQILEASKVVSDASGGKKGRIEAERVTENFAYASVVSTKNIRKGEVLSAENIWVKRPSGGDFPAYKYESLFGRVAVNDIIADRQIKVLDLE